ncbi:MAG: hypothetical protein KDA93_19585 [Planctomycetaceae bacterium]|nr:hypothetical protein [Planctomycetaceae bacterium]
MFQRIANGWELARQSWEVLKLDKELLLFPLMSGIACLIVLASFAIPLWSTQFIDVVLDEGQTIDQVLAYVVLFAFYFVNYFVIVFFNTALIACAIIRFRGGDPTVSDGLQAAFSRLPQIVAWALVSATVGVILRAIESYSDKVGQLVSALLGGAWSIATYFVVPVMVVEKAGPIDAFKRSFAVLRKSWGESLSANFGIGLITFLCSLVAIIPIVLGVMALAGGQTALGGICIACGVLALIVVSLISSALNAIVVGALYLYASDGEVPQQFDARSLSHAFVNK